MATAEQPCYTMIFESNAEYPSASELRTSLEKGSDDVKLEALRKIVVSTINGNPQPSLMMPIIQFVMPSRNKQLKKLLHFYWEVCPKYDENGKLKQEMILVVNAIRNDLQHPNEYIRGATLRFLQKIANENELLEPLIPTCRACLEHRHSYVRKNAVFALFSIYREFEHLIPDASELMSTFLAAETDSTCKRNAFIFLAHCDLPKAVDWVLGNQDSIPTLEEGLQMSVIEVVRLDCKSDSTHRARFIRLIFDLLNVSSHAVKYEAATTLTLLTQNPAAVKASASTLISLIVKESDNNVKLIVLDRLETLRSKHEHILDGLIMDVLQILGNSDMDVRRKAMNIVLSMTSSRNVEEVVQFLKKQLLRTQEKAAEFDKASEYRQLLIQSIHVTAIKFSEVAASVVLALMEFLGDSVGASSNSNAVTTSTALDVIAFIREVVDKFPRLRPGIFDRLVWEVFRGVLWILGEFVGAQDSYSSTNEAAEAIKQCIEGIRTCLGDIPIYVDSAQEETNLDDVAIHKEAGGGKPKVLADGTYATETAYNTTTSSDSQIGKARPPLRTLILGGDFFTGTVLAVTLTKLVLRFEVLCPQQSIMNALRAQAMLIMTSIIRVGHAKSSPAPGAPVVQIDEDSTERIMNCIQTLSDLTGKTKVDTDDDEAIVKEIFLRDTKKAFERMIGAQEKRAAEKRAAELAHKGSTVQVDDLLSFRQFSKKAVDQDLDYDEDLGRATGAADIREDFISNLSRISQLTGFSDPIYVETYVKMHGFDIMLDVLLVNQTANTLQNLCLDFATLGDLKIVERPSVYTIAPHGFQSIKATIKVSSTETGVIFGSILWEGPNMSEACVILNDIHIDIMDYIKPAYCNEAQFRSMWTEFEWENRVNVHSTVSDPREYLKHVMKSTNMSCLTPEGALSGDCDFLSANMYARSLFGEDALANLSIERTETGTVTGHIRIRSKTQGIALSLGDRITMAQKDNKPSAA
ncbi:coatomer protein [Lentinula raphanica]|uniref:Coatomer subunit beta n=1 Tax=Lentinula raphanica TaxID=153919 RepID=A0AA38UFI0_9AGAR|nr:coatomer protein [Lentinula raphanica]